MLSFGTDRAISVHGPAVSSLAMDMLELHAITGGEKLSELYQYTLDFLTSPDLPLENLDLKNAIGKELTVAIQLEGMGTAPNINIGSGVREISGIVTDSCFIGHGKRQNAYRLTLQPWLYLANQRVDFKIFQNKSVVQIIEEVLAPYAYSWEKRLNGQYPAMIYQVQYGESDFAFIQRMMQEHGIYWFFEHVNGQHRMILADHCGAHNPVESAAYHTLQYYPSGFKVDREYIDDFTVVESLKAGRWTMRSFDFEKPKAKLEATHAIPQPVQHNDFEHYHWPGDYTNEVDGERLAQTRMEEVHARTLVAQGSGNVRDIVCGSTFTLKGHPREDVNGDYLVLGVQLHATQPDAVTGIAKFDFEVKFDVQPADIVFRPERTLSKPRTHGPQTAMVTGPEGQEIWTDQYGRVKLKFHWDRSSVCDHHSSCWVRVSYPWAGGNYGSISIPRVGSEVIVDFENGDPSRPIVTGRVYNALDMPPWPLPENATQSGTYTRSTKGGGYGNANTIRFEDGHGKEELWVHAERDYRLEVEQDEDHHVDRDRSRVVGRDESVSVGGDKKTSVGGDSTQIIAGTLVAEVAVDSGELIAGTKAVLAGVNHIVASGVVEAAITGGAMLHLAGIGHIEVVGGAKVSEVVGIYKMGAGVGMELSCGAASIMLSPCGTITLRGTVICPNCCK